jgi:hypothetical protein
MENKQLIGSSFYVDLKHIKQLHDAWGATTQPNKNLDSNSPMVSFQIKLRSDIRKLFASNKFELDGGADFSSENLKLIQETDIPKNNIRISYYTERITYKKDRCGCEFEELVVADLAKELNKLFKKNLGKCCNVETSFSSYGQRLSCLLNKEMVELVHSASTAIQASMIIKVNAVGEAGKLHLHYANPKGMQTLAPKIRNLSVKNMMGNTILTSDVPTAIELASMGGVQKVEELLPNGTPFVAQSIAGVINTIFSNFSVALLGLPKNKANGAQIGYAKAVGMDTVVVSMHTQVQRVPIIMVGENVTVTHVFGNISEVKMNKLRKDIQNFADLQTSDLAKLNGIYNEWMVGLSKDSVLPFAGSPLTVENVLNLERDIADMTLDELNASIAKNTAALATTSKWKINGKWDFSNVTATDINTMTTVELDAYLDSFNQPVTAPTADATGGMTLLSPEQAEEAGLVGGQRGKSLVIERISNSLFNLVLRSTMK